MADQPQDKAASDESTSDQAPADETKGRRRRIARLVAYLTTRRSLLALLAVSISLHGLGYIYYTNLHHVVYDSPEVTLGTFEYQGRSDLPAAIRQASFELHLSLLTEVDNKARVRLHSRRHRVTQGVEQLLRKAQGADFEDPDLAELKRQIQERINATLDMRAVSEVIITDLDVKRTDGPAAAAPETTSPETAATSPWQEKPSG